MIKGNSGCLLEVKIKENQPILVRKTSHNLEFNSRLKTQMSLQLTFYDKKILSPIVLSNGFNGELFFFEMEYINGNTFIDWLQDGDVSTIINNISIILKQISSNIILDTQYDLNNLVQLKLESILEQISNVNFHQFIMENRSLIMDFDWSVCPITECHGDLTLENVLISEDNKIYYIDFLDSFIKTWLIDIAKLLQDTMLFWSLRYKMDDLSINYRIRLMSITNIIISFIRNWNHEAVCLVYRLMLINIFRIMPYCKDEVTEQWILKTSKIVINLIKGEELWYL